MRADPQAYEFGVDHEVETSDQVAGALDNLSRPDSDWLDWPFPHLNALCGRMAKRNVWFVCAFSGNGKTAFVGSSIERWVAEGVKTYVMPLETTAEDFRTYLAAQAIGIDPGIVSGGGLRDLSPELRAMWDARLRVELGCQALDRRIRDHLKVKGVDQINLPRLELAAEEAAAWGAKVLIVDHIDHIEGGDGSNLHAESVRVNKAAHKLARIHDLIFLFTSQMNNEAVKGGRDRLAQYGPPMPHHVFMGSHKRQIATGMIGLHRRLRSQFPGETTKEYHAALNRSRKGELPPMDALEPGVMAATAMKLRNFGAREGNRAFLRIEHGRVGHLPEKDQHGTSPGELRRL